MILEYQGTYKGVPTKFTIRIVGNNLSKSSSNYQLDLYVGDKQLPMFTTFIHQSLSNCLKEIYLFRKHNQMTFDSDSEKILSLYVPYDKVLYNYHKGMIFRA
ncbi:hypothetical protein [Flavobacterium sp. RSSB_23]|uniref:hypothetical protein n=1 Tax=Flavobacterium sp. RSSB_23 TaxID=3447668 RepID=UPI003F2F2147